MRRCVTITRYRPEIDTLVALGEDDPDVYGARLTGGGFGGSVVMLAGQQMGTAVAKRILIAYHAAHDSYRICAPSS